MIKPIVLAHRGASAVAPENTIAAFRRARELGADGIELDVMLTRDGVPVVIHDETVNRTTNGSGTVSKMTVLEIKRFDAGTWKSQAFRGETIPTLAEVFNALADWTGPGTPEPRGVINVELKSATLSTDGLELRVVKLIEEMDHQECVILSSFNPLTLAHVRMLNPRLMRGLLYDMTLPIYLRRTWLRFLAAPHALHPHHSMIDQGYMNRARRKKLLVNTWTVDEPNEALRLAALGVSGVITNKPDLIVRALTQPANPAILQI